MNTRTARLVYSTSSQENTVMIDYDQTLKLFLTGEEKVPFSAEKIIRMLNYRVQAQRVQPAVVGRLLVVVGGARCELTHQAVRILAHLYCLRRDWQEEYPNLSTFETHSVSVTPEALGRALQQRPSFFTMHPDDEDDDEEECEGDGGDDEEGL